ncbi:MAG: serine hydroxymethyltransferase [Planctomycetales bacterium 4484_123]|nr:MAG: serine hydroxymethyltransferase [Planctomycetales bacterium 4484_123]
MTYLSETDPEAYDILQAERTRQRSTLNLIASENHTTPGVHEATGSVLSDKYAEGHPNDRWYRGCEAVDRAEQLAIDRAKSLFGAEHANVQPHSGSTANTAVYLAALEPGDTLMSMDLAHGGHLSHGLETNYSGIFYKVASYTVSRSTERIDMDAVRDLALKARPRLIIAGASAYPRIIDFDAFGEIAREVGAYLMSDIAHIAGLVAGGAHPSPLPASDFVTTTTHKTLRGPRGAIILCRRQYARRIDAAVFPGLQGGPFMHEILAKAIALADAAGPQFAQYAHQVVANSRALAETLAEKGWRLVTGGTDNHLMLVDLRSRDEELTGHVASGWLDEAGIVCNKNKIPFDSRPPSQPSGLRLGTPAVTSRGLKEAQMRQLGEWIDQVLSSRGNADVIAKVRGGVKEMCEEFLAPNQRADRPDSATPARR